MSQALDGSPVEQISDPAMPVATGNDQVRLVLPDQFRQHRGGSPNPRSIVAFDPLFSQLLEVERQLRLVGLSLLIPTSPPMTLAPPDSTTCNSTISTGRRRFCARPTA